MKRIKTIAIAIAAVGAVNAQKVDLNTQIALAHVNAPVVDNVEFDGNGPQPVRMLKAYNPGQQTLPLLIEVNDADNLTSLTEAGADITGVYGNVISVNMPVDAIAGLENDDNVMSVTTSRRRRLLNDKGRTSSASNVDAVHQGTDLDREYKGDGVIVGLFDSGLDPNHINFYDDDRALSRVKRVWKYTGNAYTGKITTSTYSTPTTIANFTTDDSNETHGTHVLGIITGSYDNGTSTTRYYGMAPHADIAIACGDAYDDAILSGVKNIFNYANMVNLPAVVNLSLGTNLGHHDGTDAFSKALDAIAKDNTVVLAAGNEADTKIVARKTLSDGDLTMTTILAPNDLYLTGYYQAYGQIEVIANDNSAFTIQLGLYNTSTKAITATLDITSTSMKYWGGTSANVSNKTTNSVFTAGFSTSSYFGAARGLCPDNNRYYAMVDCDLTRKSSGKVLPVVIVKGKAGQTIEMFSEGYTVFTDNGVAGYTDGTNDGTISDMACGQYTIAIGAYSTRNAYPYSGQIVGDIVDYSSYGKLIDGRMLPHVCAPGQAIVSSMSTYYKSSSNFDSNYDKIYSTVTANGRSNYWCHMGGTSMAAPAATGIFALWLEADPTLTPADIRDIAVKTARSDRYVEGGSASEPYQWGAGKLDAHAGLVEVLRRADSGVDEIVVDNAKVVINAAGQNMYEVFVAGAHRLTASIHNMAGVCVKTVSIAGDSVTVDASGLAQGVYVMTVAGDNVSKSIKIVVK